MTVVMTTTGGLYGLVVLVGLLGGLWLRGWVERRQRQPLSKADGAGAGARRTLRRGSEIGRELFVSHQTAKPVTVRPQSGWWGRRADALVVPSSPSRCTRRHYHRPVPAPRPEASFAELLRAWRVRAGLTQEELAGGPG